MTKVSTETADHVQDYGPAIDRVTTADGYTFGFTTIREDMDLAPMLATLPGGRCSCPHWGYVLAGRVTVRYEDREEVIEAGDAFYMAPGHAPEAVAGTELVMFSPADELAATDAAIAEGLAARQ